ncbi:putative glycine cleavage system T protein [Nostocoides japonicum T1-X7]|uniref:Putative glycine cleavage system T protein n=1 Tax=Nostocoides japonicum T1-X7 TaxID=1194083 RepID=A0A077LYB0_9MICO|nr:FAD-dependent oxidoreductase [Tetrasphaera japonica]CCH76935.1 putative glycine cleavage system T protein [Tetrasphaera japonica T1-X7]
MDRLVDKNLTATVFAPDAQERTLPARARTVVIGAGIVGTSAAYHLAEGGDTDVLLLDRNVVGSGTTWHAAGLASSLRSTPAMTELAAYGIATYRRLQADTGIDVSFTQCGSLLLARTEGRLDELRHTAAVSRQMGIPVALVSPQEVVDRWPLATAEGLVGALWQPDDGHVNPGHVAVAFAKLAHERGVTIRENVRVTGIRRRAGVVTGVTTDLGDVECDRVLLAAGLWTRDLAALAGAGVPLYAAEHVHVRTAPVADADPGLPVLRDLDGYLYVRPESGCLLVGAFEPDGIPRAVGDIDAGGFAEFPPAWDHFAPVRALAEQRVPVLRRTAYERFLNAPESFTPDASFCLGETAEVAGLYVAAGFNSQGIIFGPGAGRAVAEWMSTGSPTFDAASVDVQRFARQQSNRRYLHARTREGLGRLYAMHWPHLQPVTARGVRRSPLHDRLAAAGACFGETTGWERANWFAATGTEPRYEYAYGRQNWFDAAAEEHRAARESVALFDLSSFAKVEVAGPDALEVLQEACTADVDLPVGRVRYTLMLNEGGGIELDGTVVRLGEQRFWVITPAFAQHKTFGRLDRLARGRAAAVVDVTAGYATIGVMGPRSRELMSRVSPEDWSDEAQRYTWAREVEIADTYAHCVRVSFVGELGYEIYPSADQAVNVYDALVTAGAELGLRHAGYHALDSLRCEKGYRHLGHDIGPHDDPYAAGLGFTVSMRKPHRFVGREALEQRRGAPRDRRTVHVALRDPEGLLLHDESILHEGRVVGRVTSGSYGHTIGRACGVGYVEADLPDDAHVTVDCAGTEYAADVSSTPFYDPAGSRLTG